MKSNTGPLLRAVGLLIELVGVIGVMAQARTNEIVRIPVPGGSIAIGWGLVAVGFLMWLIGRIMIARSDSGALGAERRARSSDGGHPEHE
jgi:hypothetical protein